MGRYRQGLLLALLTALAWGAPRAAGAQAPAPSPAAAARGSLTLNPGCTTVALDYAPGTPLTRVAADVQPASALRGIFRAESGGFRAFSPTAPVAMNDYTSVGARNEAAYLCVGLAAALLLPVPPLEAPPLTPGTVIAAPERVTRPQVVEVQIAAGPGLACTGGVNIPIPGPSVRWERIEAAAGAGGVAVIRFAVLAEDAPGQAHLAVRCADGRFVGLYIPIV